MKRLALIVAALAAAFVFSAPRAGAQGPPTPSYELACPAGSSTLGNGQTFDPSTSKYRQYLCVDQNGHVTFNDQVANGGSTTVPTPVYNVGQAPYNAHGNARVVTDGVWAFGSAVVTSATANFTQADVGKQLWGFMPGYGSPVQDVFPIGTTIASVQSTTQATLSATSSSVNHGGLVMEIGYDDTAAFTAANLAAQPAGKLYIPCGTYMVSSKAFAITSSWTDYQADGADQGCVTIIFSTDFPFSGTSGSVADCSATNRCNLNNITFNGEGSNPTVSNTTIVSFESATQSNELAVQNWDPPTGQTNVGIWSDTDNGYYLYPNVSVGDVGMRFNSLYTEVYDPNINGTTAVLLKENGIHFFGGNVGGQVYADSSSSTDNGFFGTHFECGGCIAIHLASGANLKITGAVFGNIGTNPDIPNMSSVQIDSGATLSASQTTFYANGTGTAVTNNGTLAMDGQAVFKLTGGGTQYAGSGVFGAHYTVNANGCGFSVTTAGACSGFGAYFDGSQHLIMQSQGGDNAGFLDLNTCGGFGGSTAYLCWDATKWYVTDHGGTPWFSVTPTEGTVKSVGVLFGALPTCNGTNIDKYASITDANTTTWGATVAGGGTPGADTLVYCDGSHWTVAGK